MKHNAYKMIALNFLLIAIMTAPTAWAMLVPEQKVITDTIGTTIQKPVPKTIEKIKPKTYTAITKAEKVVNTPKPNSNANTAPTASKTVGACADWIRQAGITDIANAQELIRRESGCNPNAINPSSGACGVAQELPCGKSGCSLGDGACQVKWMNGYVIARYKSWAGAVAFHNANNWY